MRVSPLLALAAALAAVHTIAQSCKEPLTNPAACCFNHAPAPASFNVSIGFTTGKNVTLHVERAWAPLGVDRFYAAIFCHYFDNVTVAGNEGGLFRYVPAFVVQWGIAGVPAVSAAWNTAFNDDPVLKSNLRGWVSYATAGPNTRTTQLFINLADNSGLDGQGFAPFGVMSEADTAAFEAVYSGYGGDPDQDTIYAQGDAYLHKVRRLCGCVEVSQLMDSCKWNTPCYLPPLSPPRRAFRSWTTL